MRDMRCDAVGQLFSEIYDGVAHDQALLVKHLQTCPACKAEYAAYKQMLDDVRNLPLVELPEGFHEATMAKIRELVPPGDDVIDELIGKMETRQRLSQVRRKRTNGRGFTRQWAGLAAAACVALVCIWAFSVFDLPASRDESPAAPEAMMIPDDMAAEPEMEDEAWGDNLGMTDIDDVAWNYSWDIVDEDMADIWSAPNDAAYDMDADWDMSADAPMAQPEVATIELDVHEEAEAEAPGGRAAEPLTDHEEEAVTERQLHDDGNISGGLETWAIVLAMVVFPLAIIMGIVFGRSARKNRKE